MATTIYVRQKQEKFKEYSDFCIFVLYISRKCCRISFYVPTYSNRFNYNRLIHIIILKSSEVRGLKEIYIYISSKYIFILFKIRFNVL